MKARKGWNGRVCLGRELANVPVGRLARVRYAPIADMWRRLGHVRDEPMHKSRPELVVLLDEGQLRCLSKLVELYESPTVNELTSLSVLAKDRSAAETHISDSSTVAA